MLKEFIFKDRKIGEILKLVFADCIIVGELIHLDSEKLEASINVDIDKSLSYGADIQDLLWEFGCIETHIWDISYINSWDEFNGIEVLGIINKEKSYSLLLDKLKELNISLEDFNELKEIEKLINKN